MGLALRADEKVGKFGEGAFRGRKFDGKPWQLAWKRALYTVAENKIPQNNYQCSSSSISFDFLFSPIMRLECFAISNC